MSNDLKIKDINNKLDLKLATSSWHELLQPYIQGYAHKNLMDTLLTDMTKGVKFTPALKDWFNEFFRVNFQSLKAVVVTFAHEELPFELDDQTFRLVLNRTDSDDASIENAHGSLWKFFNENVLEFVSENTSHVPIIFISPLTYPASSSLSLVSYKFFLPKITSPFWQDEENKSKTINNINKVLEKNERTKLNW
jgi:uracil DNA glycosylase